jgi:hypothetical protein
MSLAMEDSERTAAIAAALVLIEDIVPYSRHRVPRRVGVLPPGRGTRAANRAERGGAERRPCFAASSPDAVKEE